MQFVILNGLECFLLTIHMTKIILLFGMESYPASAKEHEELRMIDWIVTNRVQTNSIHATKEHYNLITDTVYLRIE